MQGKNKRVRMKKYSEIIVRLREERGENQGQFAKSFGVTQPMVSAWENGHDIPSPNFYLRLGNWASYPDCMWLWQQAGMDERAMLIAAEKKLKESGAAIVAAETVRIPCFVKTAEGTKPLDRLFAFPAESAPNPLSTMCLIVDPSAANADIPAGVRIVVDESGKDARSLGLYRDRVVLAESSIPIPGSGQKGNFATKFGALTMGRLRFKPSPITPDGTGIYSIGWVAVLDALENSFTWRPGDRGTCIGHWSYLPGRVPESGKEEARFQDFAQGRAVTELRASNGIEILGEVVAWYAAPSGESR